MAIDERLPTGEEAEDVLNIIERVGPEMAIRRRSQWNYGDEAGDAALVNGYEYNEIPRSATDRVIGDSASTYAVTYNRPFGYVALLRHFTSTSRSVWALQVSQTGFPPVCRPRPSSP